MTGPAASRSEDNGENQSVGDLVALAVKDVSQLVRCELDLAKLELRDDARRLGLAGALLGIGVFVGCLVLILLCFALAYGLITLGIWAWAAFLIVAGLCVVMAGVAVLVVAMKVRRVTGLRRTRKSVRDSLALLRRGEGDAAPEPAKAG